MAAVRVWYWACALKDSEPAGNRFIIAADKEILWDRVDCLGWSQSGLSVYDNSVGSSQRRFNHADLLELALHVIPQYGVAHNTFLIEAAQIPLFAKFAKQFGSNLHVLASNPVGDHWRIAPEHYDLDTVKTIRNRVSETLGVNNNWWEG